MNVVDNAAGYFSIVVAETCMPNAIGGVLNKKNRNLHTNSSDFIWSNSMVPLFSMFLGDQSLSICICQLSNSFNKVEKHNFTRQKICLFL